MYTEALASHYEHVWASQSQLCNWSGGPIRDILPNFSVLKFGPRDSRAMWTYATCGMSEEITTSPVELHLFSQAEDDSLCELLSAIAHFHNIGEALGLGHTVNFGRPWSESSACTYGLISLPYLDGPELENFTFGGRNIRCLWLVPITEAERQFKIVQGLEKLEEQFEASGFNYADPLRPSVT